MNQQQEKEFNRTFLNASAIAPTKEEVKAFITKMLYDHQEGFRKMVEGQLEKEKEAGRHDAAAALMQILSLFPSI